MLKSYFLQHKYAFKQGWRQLTQRSLGTFLTIAVLSVSLVLPTGLLLILTHAETLTDNLNTSSVVSVYISPKASTTQVQMIEKSVRELSNVETVEMISPAQGLKNFTEQTGLANVLKDLDNNPLPTLLSVTPNNQSVPALNILVSQLQAMPNVDDVKLDIQWIQRLNTMIILLQRFTYGLSILLGLAVLLIIGNTIRLAIQSYHQEIEVIKLVGGSDRFIRRPFLYSGLLYGISSGIFAAVILDFFLLWLQGPVNQLASFYNAEIHLEGLSLEQTGWLLLASTLLGYLGSWLAVGRELAKFK
jgi:cell division transport system permease protein